MQPLSLVGGWISDDHRQLCIPMSSLVRRAQHKSNTTVYKSIPWILSRSNSSRGQKATNSQSCSQRPVTPNIWLILFEEGFCRPEQQIQHLTSRARSSSNSALAREALSRSDLFVFFLDVSTLAWYFSKSNCDN